MMLLLLEVIRYGEEVRMGRDLKIIFLILQRAGI